MSFWRRNVDDGHKAVVELTDGTFEQFISSNGRAVVEVYSAGCSHCKRMAPIYENVALSSGGKATFAKLDGIKHPLMPRRYDVFVTPTFLFFKQGEVVGTAKGEMVRTQLEGQIVIYLG